MRERQGVAHGCGAGRAYHVERRYGCQRLFRPSFLGQSRGSNGLRTTLWIGQTSSASFGRHDARYLFCCSRLLRFAVTRTSIRGRSFDGCFGLEREVTPKSLICNSEKRLAGGFAEEPNKRTSLSGFAVLNTIWLTRPSPKRLLQCRCRSGLLQSDPSVFSVSRIVRPAEAVTHPFFPLLSSTAIRFPLQKHTPIPRRLTGSLRPPDLPSQTPSTSPPLPSPCGLSLSLV